MTNVIRVALPGYNALTDTNPNHFSLFTDEETDHILIKEHSRAEITVAASSTETIAHNLGYIPNYACYVELNTNEFLWVHGYNIYLSYRVYVDTTHLYLINNGSGSKIFKYYLFYDNQTGVSNNVVPMTLPGIAVARIGKSAFSKDPNDFIFRSDLNTFKIIEEGTYSPTLTSTAVEQLTSVNHGKSYMPFVFAFCKYADGYVAPAGGIARTASFWYSSLRVTDTQIQFGYINDTGGNYTPTFKYYITENPF